MLSLFGLGANTLTASRRALYTGRKKDVMFDLKSYYENNIPKCCCTCKHKESSLCDICADNTEINRKAEFATYLSLLNVVPYEVAEVLATAKRFPLFQGLILKKFEHRKYKSGLGLDDGEHFAKASIHYGVPVVSGDGESANIPAVIALPWSKAGDKAVKAIYDTLDSRGCDCTYDCCGCESRFATDVTFVGFAGLQAWYTVNIHSYINV